MLIIGLTGGIGSGKSTAADYFAELGVPVIDADVVAREVVTKGSAGLEEIIQQFGAHYLDENGELNRKRLREHIFDNPSAREQLQSILHPLIRIEMQRQAALLKEPYCIFVIPLLIETNQQSIVDRILVIDCSEETQRERIMLRDGIDADQADKIIASQATRQERLAQADDIINGEGDVKRLYAQLDKLHQRYLSMASAKKNADPDRSAPL